MVNEAQTHASLGLTLLYYRGQVQLAALWSAAETTINAQFKIRNCYTGNLPNAHIDKPCGCNTLCRNYSNDQKDVLPTYLPIKPLPITYNIIYISYLYLFTRPQMKFRPINRQMKICRPSADHSDDLTESVEVALEACAGIEPCH